MNNYDLLIQKIDAFIRKFYLNRLIKGVLVFLACALAAFLILNIGEYFFYFSSTIKISLLILIAITGIFALVNWIIIPLLKMQGLGKIISHQQAAEIIGIHFSNIQDKLLNILQLRENKYSAESMELVEAGIHQKSSEIAVVPFLSAIKLGENKKYLPYVLPTLFIILILFVFAPNLFQTATSRLMQPATNFSAPAPFSFVILNKKLEVPLNENYTLSVKVEGEKLPEEVIIKLGNEELLMEKKDKNSFVYSFQNVNQSLDFHLEAAKVKSPNYHLALLEKPLPEGFQMEITYPPYTKIANQKLESMTDVTIPEGTTIKWFIQAKFTDKITMDFGHSGTEKAMITKNNSEWNYSMKLFNDTTYSIYLSNKNMPKSDSFNYRVQVIKDQSPQVLLEQFKDIISGQQILLTGQASDDYGLTELNFRYFILNTDKERIAEKKISLQKPSGKVYSFQHYFDLATIQLQPGQEINYFIEAWDNDGIHGRKRGVSELYQYRRPDNKELDEIMRENSEQMSRSMSNSANQSKELKKDMEKLKDQLLQSKSMSWEQEQNMKSLMDKQTQLKDQVESLKKRFEEQKRQSEQKNFSEKVQEKQEALEKQLDRLLNQELAEQLKKLQELLEEKNKANAMENLQKMEEKNKLFDMDMERIQSLMKQLEMQMKLEDMANKLADLAKEERSLEQKTEKGEQSNEALSKEQNELKKELEDILAKDFKDLEKLNKEQDQPQELSDQKETGEDAKGEMQESESALKNAQKKKAKEAQNKAAEKLEKMAASLSQMAAGMEMEQIDIDIKAVRQLLTNLLRFSFDQEALMEKEKTIPITSPLFVQHAQEQNKLKGNAEMIKDSLFVLSKRVFQLAPSINKETTELSSNIKNAISFLESRRVNDARVQQQFAMANANNLALLLNETLSNLMQSQAEMSGAGQPKPGEGKPGKGKPGSPPGKGKPGDAGEGMKDIITGQQKLGEGLKKAQQGQGKKPGESGKGGESGSGGEGEGNSEELAKLAQQQAQLRKQIQDLSSQLNSSGGGGKNAKILQEIQQQMDKNETDIVNKRLNSELIRRQQDILTRMLEAEKSIRNQDEDDKRSANTGKDLARPMPPELEKHLRERQEFFDTYKTAPPVLKPFYQKMSEDYLKNVK